MPKYDIRIQARIVDRLVDKLGVEHQIDEVKSVQARSQKEAARRVRNNFVKKYEEDDDRSIVQSLIG